MRPRRGVAALGIVLLVACSKAPQPASTRQDGAVIAHAAPPTADDSAATLAWFEQRAGMIDADTLRFTRRRYPLALGASTAGTLTAWRDGAIWTRLRVETRGAGFQSNDNYWLLDGVLLGARLTVLRPGRRPAVDHIWFRDMALYRWTDASGDHLNPAARSTQYEVRMMRARYDSLLHILASDDLTRLQPTNAEPSTTSHRNRRSALRCRGCTRRARHMATGESRLRAGGWPRGVRHVERWALSAQ